jgi:hypothetical protein
MWPSGQFFRSLRQPGRRSNPTKGPAVKTRLVAASAVPHLPRDRRAGGPGSGPELRCGAARSGGNYFCYGQQVYWIRDEANLALRWGN